MPLQPRPKELHRLEVWRVRRQKRHLDVAIGGVQLFAYKLAAMCAQAVPDDQWRLLEMGTQFLEELDVLLLLDAALVQPEHAVGTAQTCDDGYMGPVEVELDDGSLESCPWAPRPHPGWPLAQSRLVDEDNQSALALGFF